MGDVTPVESKDRVLSLDVVRGFAVLGILAVNAQFFAAPWQTGVNPGLAPLGVTDETAWSWLLMHVAFELKCVTLFSMLFGASIFLVGGDGGDQARNGVLVRRLLWLLVFGLIHALFIWYGDILVLYALTGLMVMFARSWAPSRLIGAGVGLYLFQVGVHALSNAALNTMSAGDLARVSASFWSPPQNELDRIAAAYRGNASSVLQENASTWLKFLFDSVVGFMPRTAGLMMIGMALWKLGFWSGAAARWVYWVFLALGVALFALVAYQGRLEVESGFAFPHSFTDGRMANFAFSVFGSLGYASLFILLAHARWRVVTGPLAAVGRMAFTNYLTQSLIMTTIFWGGRGFGLFGRLDRAELWGVVVAIWALQLIWSPLWLSRFEMGPFEWMWRRVSYGKPVRISRAAIR